MAELHRSVTSFRRHGSSGLVWNDKFLPGVKEQNQNQQATSKRYQEENGRAETRELRQSQSVGSTSMLERSQSAGACPHGTVKVAPPSKDPSSPKATSWLCGIFGKPVVATHRSNPKSKKRR